MSTLAEHLTAALAERQRSVRALRKSLRDYTIQVYQESARHFITQVVTNGRPLHIGDFNASPFSQTNISNFAGAALQHPRDNYRVIADTLADLYEKDGIDIEVRFVPQSDAIAIIRMSLNQD